MKKAQFVSVYSISIYQVLKVLHLFFAGLFAFVLPLICWGSIADPLHPHQLPHFVFKEPQIEHFKKVTSASIHKDEPVGKHFADHHPSSDLYNDDIPVGRAQSALVLFSILAVLMLEIWNLVRFERPIVVYVSTVVLKSIPSVPPFLPPRLAV